MPSIRTYEASSELGNKPGKPCKNCGHPGYDHEKERVYPDDSPAGQYHYRYRCPE